MRYSATYPNRPVRTIEDSLPAKEVVLFFALLLVPIALLLIQSV